jgi:hypothetical protein
VLDIEIFSSIIYIWYEGGELRPSLVRFEEIPTSLFRSPGEPGDQPPGWTITGGSTSRRYTGGRCHDAKSAEFT